MNESKDLERHQVKSRWYYIFWAAMSVAVVASTSSNTYAQLELVKSNIKMTETIRDYILIKPFPIQCR